MAQILQGLSDATGRTVVNRTELTGSFDLDLHWTPDQIQQKPTGTPNRHRPTRVVRRFLPRYRNSSG
jgi:uncharacterized protein (TIGR03435 family)